MLLSFLFSLLIALPVQCTAAALLFERRSLDLDGSQARLGLSDALSANSNLIPPSEVSCTEKTLSMAYYPSWAASSLPPEDIDFLRLCWIDFAFAELTEDHDVEFDHEVLKRLIKVAHLAKRHVKLSVGGWSGSKYFSGAVATNASRTRLATTLTGIYDKYRLDGIDIDWEYPGHDGEPGNQVNGRDTENFCSFLRLLREKLPSDARITAAAQTVPFVDADGEPLNDASCFADVLDWVLIMNYDTWGSSDNPGPNAPLNDNCHNSSQTDASAVASYNAWTSAGFSPDKMVLGLPSYGYISNSYATHLKQRSILPPRLQWTPRRSHLATTDATVKVVTDDQEGQIQFKDLVHQGALVLKPSKDGQPASFVGDSGFERYWDDCSSTPFLQSSSSGQLITYDDTFSLRMKAEWARDVGMCGVSLFSIDGDTREWHLMAAIGKALVGRVDT